MHFHFTVSIGDKQIMWPKWVMCFFSHIWIYLLGFWYESQVSLDSKVTLFLPFLLQNSKNAQGLVGLRNLGNTVSISKQIIYSLIYSSYKNENSVKGHSPLCRCKLLSKRLFQKDCRLCMLSNHLILPFSNVSLQCFMNSILQCLSNTHDLRDYCLRNTHRTDLNNNCRAKAVLMEGKRHVYQFI